MFSNNQDQRLSTADQVSTNVSTADQRQNAGQPQRSTARGLIQNGNLARRNTVNQMTGNNHGQSLSTADHVQQNRNQHKSQIMLCQF